MTEEGCSATWGYFSHLDARWLCWMAEGERDALEQGWPKPPGVHPPPLLFFPLCLRAHTSPSDLSGMPGSSQQDFPHPPQSSLQPCCDPVPQRHTWPEGFPGKTKGLTMNFALTRRHTLPLNRRPWDLMKVNCEYMFIFFFSPFPFSHQWLVSQSQENHEWLNMHFLINAQRRDLDLRGNSVMCAQVHVWEISACIFNVAFYRNESNRGRAAGKMCVSLFFWRTWCIEKCHTLDWIRIYLVTYRVHFEAY